MLERFTRERQRSAKGSAFNLDDEDELTHYGQSLSKLDDFDASGMQLDDDDDEETDESLLFVMKPEQPSPEEKETLPLPQDVHRMSRVSSQGKRSRDGTTHPEPSRASSMKTVETAGAGADTEKVQVTATERLREQAENAQNRNIVLELELDGDRIIWINYAWFVVVG